MITFRTLLGLYLNIIFIPLALWHMPTYNGLSLMLTLVWIFTTYLAIDIHVTSRNNK